MFHFRSILMASVVSVAAFSAVASTNPDDGTRGNYADLIGAGEGGHGDAAWSATNPGSTATGRYQFLFEHFVNQGYVAPGSKKPSPGSGEWTGVTFTGKNGVYSRSDFMNNRAAQDSMLDVLTQQNWNSIASKTPLGTTVNGVQMTQGGALYAAHMLGAGGYNTWASCNFQAHCLDAKIAADHGWTQQEYNDHLMGRIAKGGGYDPSIVASSGGGMGGSTPAIDAIPLSLMPWT